MSMMRSHFPSLSVAALTFAAVGLGHPDDVNAATTDAAADAEIIVYGRAIHLLGIVQAGSQGVVGYEDFEQRPILHTGD